MHGHAGACNNASEHTEQVQQTGRSADRAACRTSLVSYINPTLMA